MKKFIGVKFMCPRTIEASSRNFIANCGQNGRLDLQSGHGREQELQPGAMNGTLHGTGTSRMQTIRDPAEMPDLETKADANAAETAPPGADAVAGLKVMVLDDSKTIRRTAETLLKKEGCEVITATDGFEALAKIADEKPHIIFVDIMMPRLDGYQTCALIKNNRVFKRTPVVMLSSKDGLFDRARGRIVGSDQYLTKPFTKDELLGAIRQHVRV
jgi:twitching motility two-component system response regulator PilG